MEYPMRDSHDGEGDKVEEPTAAYGAALGDRLRSVRRRLGLGQPEAARVMSLSVRTVSGLENGLVAARSEHLRRVVELEELADELGRTLRPEAVRGWMMAPLPALGGGTALQQIELGRMGAVLQLLWRLQHGIPVE